MRFSLPATPILDVLPALRAALQAHRNAVLEAPPGAGKSTVVPLALLDEPWLGADKRIVLLQPRRIAARAVARRLSQLAGSEPGQLVGYRTRLETRVSAATRIEVVTEGILARRLQGDPALEDVGCVIFDEFHERNLQSDLGLALALDAQRHLRDDLRLLVMSATLDGAAVAAILGDAGTVRSEGRAFAVTTHYSAPAPAARQPLARTRRAACCSHRPACAGVRSRRRARLSAGRRGNPALLRRHRRRSERSVAAGPAAIWRSRRCGTGYGAASRASGAPQSRRRHEPRRNQPHDRRGASRR